MDDSEIGMDRAEEVLSEVSKVGSGGIECAVHARAYAQIELLRG
jgi:translation elongation factor EF-1beta